MVQTYFERAENDKNTVNHGMTFIVALIAAMLVYRMISVLAF